MFFFQRISSSRSKVIYPTASRVELGLTGPVKRPMMLIE